MSRPVLARCRYARPLNYRTITLKMLDREFPSGIILKRSKLAQSLFYAYLTISSTEPPLWNSQDGATITQMNQ